MRKRDELTDAAWAQISPLLPKNGRKGKQWRDQRRVIDGILWRLRTGAPWRQLRWPECYGPWQTSSSTGSFAGAGSVPHVIPERKDQQRKRAERPGRKPNFDRDLYAARNVVERCVKKLKQWRAIATRYDKRAVNYRAAILVASLVIWLTS